MRFQAAEGTGPAIRKLRLAKGWTLAELSKQTGVPLATLSRVELGQNALNYDKLVRLCRALDIDVQGMVTREAVGVTTPSGRRSVIRAGEGEPARIGGAAGLRGAADLLDKAFTPTVLSLTASRLSDLGSMTTLPGEAYLLVISGVAVLHSQLYAPLTLKAGDGLYFDGRSPHALLAGDEGPAQVALIVTGDHRFEA
jgi:transcriptional regulator with XRE-family HTH domain